MHLMQWDPDAQAKILKSLPAKLLIGLVLGMIVGSAFSHNFGLAGAAASADAAGGVGAKGRVAIIIGFVVFAIISVMHLPKKEEA